MTWEEYYDKFYDWAESTQIKKLSSVEALEPAEEVTEVMVSFAFDHEDIVNRIARKAIEQRIVFSGENIADLTNFIDPQLQNQLTLQSADSFDEEDLNHLLGMVDDDIVASLYKKKGYKIPDEYSFIDDSDDFDEEYEDSEPEVADSTFTEKRPSGFFSRLAMAFGVGHGISQGINDATTRKTRKFRVGDHVRVRYRGQEGTIVDINGDLYMVSLNDGGHVDSYSESQLERAW